MALHYCTTMPCPICSSQTSGPARFVGFTWPTYPPPPPLSDADVERIADRVIAKIADRERTR